MNYRVSLNDGNRDERQVKSSIGKILAEYDVMEGTLYALVTLVCFLATAFFFANVIRPLPVVNSDGIVVNYE
ncbi:hypothetical protein PF005_g14272 [Phytophthora fragariae]|uniref:Uncharacterized protein n=1 Tax=Phytophthora fragariae TaxID=53985 RepID=A0A6A3KA37_9STRA|nr:hypothetical protein PF011_g13326 [Phytophthora fragariae]KAE9203243.1 hypothetical protein PF005_g14272 [Phytophthora fragariae]KAE9219656.1 hypothetical protein PF004_g13547 [Phytophthora fragariae]